MKINVKHVAKLANLPLTPEEENKFETQLSSILEYVGKLSEVDVSKVSQTSQVTGLENVFREDSVKPSLSQADALKNAPETQKGFFKVTAILDE